jgi:hypothetical protein
MGERIIDHRSRDRLYPIWNGMISRCYNNNHPKYHLWGGRGIKICDEWRNDYWAFKKWAVANGYDESKHRKYQTIERVDNDGDYCPENCKWATAKEQRANCRKLGRKPRVRGRGYKYNWNIGGVTKSAIDWCAEYGLSVPMVMYRVKTKGMTPYEALTTPKEAQGRPAKES